MPQQQRVDRPMIFETLSTREQQVAALVCQGLSNKVIGRQLNLTEGTVKAHLHNIFGKLGVESRRKLLAVLVRSAAD